MEERKFDEQQLKEIFSDEEFVKSLLELEEPAEVQKALAEKGLELTEDEINYIRHLIENNEELSEELSEEQLEDVSGGFGFAIAITALSLIAATCASGISGSVSYVIAKRTRW